MRPTPFCALVKSMNASHKSQILIHGAAIDSRLVKPGDLFFALPGKRTNGHLFLKEAAERGAAAAIVDESYIGPQFGLPLLHVSNVLECLQQLARKRLQVRKVKVSSITGSLGKTMTKEFATTLISKNLRVFSSPLSYNTQASLPLSVLISDETEELLILEMGMTEQGQISNLLSIAPPDVAVLTTVAVQHATHFKNGLRGIREEKAMIFSHPKTTIGIVNREIIDFDQVSKVGSCEKLSFSTTRKEADYFLETASGGYIVYFRGEKKCTLPITLPLKVHAQNLLAAIALARTFDLSWSDITEASRYLKLPAMRFEKIKKGEILFINDAYNASPDSMIAALEGLPQPQEGGKKIGVLSEMDALGSYSDEGHQQVAMSSLKHLDVLLCIGTRCEIMHKLWRDSKKNVYYLGSVDEIGKRLKEIVQSNDIVLLKGARSYALETILTYF